jgi:hypothetical protein
VKPVEMPKSIRPGRQRVQGGQPARRDRRDPVGWNEDAGAEADRVVCIAAAAIEANELGVQELRVVEPGAAEAEALGALDDFPRVGGGARRCRSSSRLSPGL